MRVRRSGFRVQGSGFRVQGSGFRVQGSGFRVQGSGFRVYVLEGLGVVRRLELWHLEILERRLCVVFGVWDLVIRV